MDIVVTVVSALIVLGILIFVHELGHFLVAKKAGVGVTTFSLGFGPKLWAMTKGETEYRLSMIPLGGYVRMVGENPGEEVAPEDIPRSFSHKSVGWRLAIVGAGPGSNLLFALVAYYLLLVVWGAPAPLSAQMGQLVPDMPAMEAGLQPGDLVVAIDGNKIADWEQMREAILESEGRTLQFTIDRGGRELTLPVTPRAREGSNLFGEKVQQYVIGATRDAQPYPAKVGKVISGGPAAQAGIEADDLILSVSGKQVRSWGHMMELLVQGKGEPALLVLKRRGLRHEVTLTPRPEKVNGPGNNKRTVYHMGMAANSEYFSRPVGFLEAIPLALEDTYMAGNLIFMTVVKLFQRKVALKNLGGPILIAQAAGEAAKLGLASLLSLAALISVNLAILNLLPIPALDGGHLFFYLIEAITRRKVPLKVRQFAQTFGVGLLLFLMAMVFYNDIARIVGGGAG